jgi:hypothetical protein
MTEFNRYIEIVFVREMKVGEENVEKETSNHGPYGHDWIRKFICDSFG